MSLNQPQRADIWLVNFDPTVGSEIQKTRPALVISSDTVGRLPMKIVAPLTDWKPHYEFNLWHVKIVPDSQNGLQKLSAIDVLQVRGVSLQRFVKRLGITTSHITEQVVMALADVTECP